MNFFSSELSAKQLGFLPELVPGATPIAVLVNPADAAVAGATVLKPFLRSRAACATAP
jgi:hypothetical protein